MKKLTVKNLCPVAGRVLTVDVFYTARISNAILENPIKYAVNCRSNCDFRYNSVNCPLFQNAPETLI